MDQSYEQLGLFYLGRQVAPEALLAPTDDSNNPYYLLRSKDLLTHALCVGMTGSGKTGLCTALIEEAGIDGIPAIVIDPKGDLVNLALSFDPMTRTELAPWVRQQDVEQSGLSREAYAAETAEAWTQALARDDQSTARVRLWRESSDIRIYTPGLGAIAPLSIISRFTLPPAETLSDLEASTDLATGYATAVLALLGKSADPLEDREHILLSQILLHAWQAGESPRLEDLITAVQEPPFKRLGVLDLETFFPAKERFQLAMELNKLLAAPGFAAWRTGAPLDIEKLLYGPGNKPQTAIISLQHLSESERIFFMTLLLNQLLAWTRRQKGTQSLRALFYMDEIQGYFPPVAEPPTKKPLLTLLKQARAYGLGIVLATQNPVDLDYKGLANIGLWLVGRLQTERDRAKVIEGLRAAVQVAGGQEQQPLEQWLSALPKRHFLARNVHREGLQIFRSRQTLSYLAGPLSRVELSQLVATQPVTTESELSLPDEIEASRGKAQESAVEPENLVETAAATQTELKSTAPLEEQGTEVAGSRQEARQSIPEGIESYYLPRGTGQQLRPQLLALTEIFYEDKTRGIRQEEERAYLAPFESGLLPINWAEAEEIPDPRRELEALPDHKIYGELPEVARDIKQYKKWSTDLVDYLYKNASYTVLENKNFKLTAAPGESRSDFEKRLVQELRELRDHELDAYEQKFQARLRTLGRQKLAAEQKVEREQEQAQDAKRQTLISMGNAIFSTIFGSKKVSSGNIGKMATAARTASRSGKQKADITRAEERLAKLTADEEAIMEDLALGLDEVKEKFERRLAEITEYELRPLKRDCKVKLLALVWTELQ